MGQPVVHFEIIGRDGPALQRWYADQFGWQPDANNPMKYGVINRDDNLSPDGMGIDGGIGEGPDGYEGHITFYVAVPDVEAALQKVEAAGGTRVMGPETVMENIVVGMFTDPEGHVVGLVNPQM